MYHKVQRLFNVCLGQSRMGWEVERCIIKAAAVLLALGYCSLLVYQSGVTFNFQERRSQALQDADITLTTVSPNESLTRELKRNITLDDIFISVKTSKHYQYTRLPIILKTWFQLAKKQTWFFTDTENQLHQKITGGHMVNTKCSATHQQMHLCCKTAVEFDTYLESGKRWFCHFDDDNYVNVPKLLEVLQRYNYQKEWYLGRTSVYEPVTGYDKHRKNKYSFWFATGGAGYCISRSLALRMLPVASGGRFISVCDRISYPDDVSMGYIIEFLMKTNMTALPQFHSHLEPMKLLNSETFRDQVSFSYYLPPTKAKKTLAKNVLDVPGFSLRYDPTRFLSLHCFLFPHFEYCPSMNI